MRKRLSIAAASAIVLLAAPSAAHAADTFVDQETGSDANNCTQAAPGGVNVGPCLTVGAAITKTGAGGGTVRIDRGDTFLESATLTTGVSLIGAEVNAADTGPAILDGGAGGSAIVVNFGTNAGTIQGLTVRSNSTGIFASGTVARITGNLFDEPANTTGVALFGTSNALVDLNTFTGNDIGLQVGIIVGDGSVTVRDNTFSGHSLAIDIDGNGGVSATSTPTISSNTITGVHQAGFSSGGGIAVLGGSNPTIVGNRISAPLPGSTSGISVNGSGEETTTGMTLRRNRVEGAFTNGIDIRDTALPVSSNGDLITGATQFGLNLEDQGANGAGIANADVVNATIWDNFQDIATFQNALTLDSTITEDPISATTATCAIAFSRGPTTTGTPCQTFQTSAAPLFASAADLHLQPGSPMIDAGNPAALLAGVLDIDGQPRALDPTPSCSPNGGRRDIGADEFLAAPPPGCNPPTQPVLLPPTQTTKKKCKKGRKLKKGKCVKKKRKRKRTTTK